MQQYNIEVTVLNDNVTEFPELSLELINEQCCGPFIMKTARSVITQIR